MYAKVFSQIFDSSIAEDYRVRLVFEDLLKLANQDGVVDMTHESIARRTNVPVDIITMAISKLEAPDLKSRSPAHEGRRIVRLDEHRDWGWFIVNHAHYRSLVTEHQRREKTKVRTQKWRNSKDKRIGDAPVTPCDAGDAKQKQKQKQKQGERELIPPSPQERQMLERVREVFDAWNKLEVVPKCLLISDKRRRYLEVRLRDPFFTANWESAMTKIKVSSFCQGENVRRWRASLDWFIQPDSVAKTMEGKYDNNTPTQQQKIGRIAV